MNFLDIQHIRKSYSKKPILKDLSFSVKNNSIFGLMGPNGAGKTTLLRLLTRITLPDSGQIIFDGENFSKKHITQIGYMPEERGLYKNMSVREHLYYFARLYGIERKKAKVEVRDWLERMEMTEARRKKVRSLSKGMSQKIQFIATVMHRPKLLILDEPFSGLDPLSAELLEKQIKAIRETGTTIILSTHRMEQIEHFCDDIVLIDHGEKVIEGSVEDLKQHFKKGEVEVGYMGKMNGFLADYDVVRQNSKDLTVKFRNLKEQRQFLGELVDHDITLTRFEEKLPSVRDIFMNLVKEVRA